MDFEYWWLIGFPVFFGFGWVAARIDIKHLLTESRQLPSSYFKGLNFLLNEQPDKAIEALIEVATADRETIELHFALGSLFRRRGETERAIRMHRTLLDRGDLADEQRLQALFELAQDYLKAGLLDRAEEAFNRLRVGHYRPDALNFLVEIYQQEKDWEKAISVARELEADGGESRQRNIANYYCELAALHASHSRTEDARRCLTEALAASRKCVRANLILGELQVGVGEHEAAIETWKKIEQQQPAYLALCARGMLDAFRVIGRAEEGLVLLKGYLARYPSLDLLDIAFQSTLELNGAESAYLLVKEELRRNPTLLGLDKLLEAQIMVVPVERRPDLELVKNLVHNHTRRLARYRCENCGFKARQFYWHCPGCGGWETYPPRRTEEFDLLP
jgi:lipopolysaccharide biosynthesis regulator YciM